MEILLAVVKYTFVALLAAEVLLMLRAVVRLAREKARAAQAAPAAEE
ncbi:MAG: hypothetical protein DIU80_006160 [Chloroflexota bacterium]